MESVNVAGQSAILDVNLQELAQLREEYAGLTTEAERPENLRQRQAVIARVNEWLGGNKTDFNNLLNS
jgi:hypothetical protein